ncbi:MULTISPECIES: response regulator transcription factor [Streptomyces]|uniref:Response regulator transcription factor n=1 Tax=Streptomyces lonegramiae TaxID=3075524 RepID=A0ABU2XNH2_9ACTN|nr:response regulator transcription factor [Streptomyces sp. DSM 41529]MDT0546625.1 response regulator transcription factor [Streptomyces sp. DSM 41529]
MTAPADLTKVLIVEDHRVVAEGLWALLAEYSDLTVVGWADSVAEVVPMAKELGPDVALVDFRLPDGTGADAAAAIRANDPSTAIVILSADASDSALLAAVEAGACGYLLKSASGDEIAAAIRSAAEGETLIPASTLVEVLARHRENARSSAQQTERLESLTPREQEILTLMSQGLDNRAVAERLSISYATVRTHVRKILEKLEVRSQLEAVAKAADWGFRHVEPDE